MASTTEHITIRLPKHVVDLLRSEAKQHDRSLSWMIGYRLAQLNASLDAEIIASSPTIQSRRVAAEASSLSNENDLPANLYPAPCSGKLVSMELVKEIGLSSLQVPTIDALPAIVSNRPTRIPEAHSSNCRCFMCR